MSKGASLDILRTAGTDAAPYSSAGRVAATGVGLRRGKDHAALSNKKLAMVWLLLLFVTWVTPVASALNKTLLTDEDTGTVVVLFPIGSTPSENFERILGAGGGFVGQTWLEQAWIASSYERGFVGRLKAEGAWAIFHPVLLDPAALLGCGATVIVRDS